MARVSQQHLDARRRQILDGARRSFTRNGFHATSMQDVLREVDLSAGAVYRYFRSKNDLIEAIAVEAMDSIRAAFESVMSTEPLPPLDRVLGQVLRQVFGEDEEDPAAFPRLVLQVWSETLRNPELARSLSRSYVELRDAWSGLVVAYQRDGRLRGDIPEDDVARLLIGTVQGYLTQQALFGDVDIESFESGLRGLMATEGRPAG
ncbi:TetR/AcrR family transcriptional regulator [Streptomyces capparidis]